jgi:hypothetical protein
VGKIPPEEPKGLPPKEGHTRSSHPHRPAPAGSLMVGPRQVSGWLSSSSAISSSGNLSVTRWCHPASPPTLAKPGRTQISSER